MRRALPWHHRTVTTATIHTEHGDRGVALAGATGGLTSIAVTP